MIKRIYFFILSFYCLFFVWQAKTSERFELKGPKNIEVLLENGDKMSLGPGAQIRVSRSEDSGWAWSVQVIRRSKEASIETKPTWARIEKQSLHNYIDEGLLSEVRASRPAKDKIFEIKGTEAVEVLNGHERLYLEQGDRFERVEEEDESWKAALVVRSSQNPQLVGQKVHIGRVFLNQLQESGHITTSSQVPEREKDHGQIRPRARPSRSSSAPARIRPRARPQEIELNTSFVCPAPGGYRVKQNFFFDPLDERDQGDVLSIPKGALIDVVDVQSERGCQFVLTETSEPELSDFIGSALLTSPGNLSEQSLAVHLSKEERQSAQSEVLDFEKGTAFMLSSPGMISGLNVGKKRSETMPSSFVYEVQQTGPNFIQLRGENGDDYLVERSDLDDLRLHGDVIFDGAWSLGQTMEEVQDPQVGELPKDCPPGTSQNVDWQSEDPIVWESCRTRDQVGSNGRRLAANNYYDDLIERLGNFGHEQKQQWLQDPSQRELTKCIKQSLKAGLNRNVRPVCEFDSQGNLKQRPIRKSVTKTNSNGDEYTAQKVLNRAPRACASEKTSTFLAQRFERASRCLGLDPFELFNLINHESHFQPGAISPTGALSVGQTVISNYLQIHTNLQRAKSLISKGGQKLEQVRRFSDPESYRREYENSNQRTQARYTVFLVSELEDKIKNPKAHGCEDLAQLLENPFQAPGDKDPAQHVLDTENRRLCLPQQPGQSFLMAGLDYLANKKYAQALVENWEGAGAASAGSKARHLKQVSQILGKWMYNGGQEGTARSFEYFMQELEAGRVTMRDDQLNPVVKNGSTQTISARNLSELSLEEFKKYMSVHIKQRYPGGSARKTEVAGYIQKMDRDVQRIEKRGIQCTP